MVPFFHNSVNFTPGLALGIAFTLVMQFFALAQAQFYLHPAVFKIQRERNECNAILHYLRLKFHDLPLVHQKSARANRIPVKDISMFVRADMHSPHKQFSILNRTEAILQIDLAGPDRFHFGSCELDPSLKAFQDKVFMKSLTIIGYFFDARLLWQE